MKPRQAQFSETSAYQVSFINCPWELRPETPCVLERDELWFHEATQADQETGQLRYVSHCLTSQRWFTDKCSVARWRSWPCLCPCHKPWCVYFYVTMYLCYFLNISCTVSWNPGTFSSYQKSTFLLVQSFSWSLVNIYKTPVMYGIQEKQGWIKQVPDFQGPRGQQEEHNILNTYFDCGPQ